MYNIESKLSDILLSNPSVVTVVNRFGIYLGVGDATVYSAAKRLGLSPEFLLMVINTYLNSDYIPSEDLTSHADIAGIVDYLEKTDSYYRRFQLPNIERHFNSLVSRSDGENDNLEMLRSFFMDLKQELLSRIDLDTEEFFPMVRDVTRDKVDNAKLADCAQRLVSLDLSIEDRLSDLSSFFIIHLKGNYDTNLCIAVVSAVFALGNDIRHNNRLRRHILLPMLETHV